MHTFLLKIKPFLLSSAIVLAVGLIVASFSPANALTPYQDTTKKQIKDSALVVLKNKCNECHLKKKPTYVFTSDNMNLFVYDIKKQVFVKEKMPKGRGNELTDKEKATLKKWVTLMIEN